MTVLPTRDELLAFVLRFVQDVRHRERIDIVDDSRGDFMAVGGLLHRVRRLARAYVKLLAAGHGPEGKVLVRSALEHAVTAQWAYLVVGGTDRLTVSLARGQADMADEMSLYSADPGWASAAADIRAVVPEGKALPKFTGPEGIMRELDSVRFLNTTYKILSQVGHVSHEAALDFFVEEEGEIQLRTDPEKSLEHEVIYALAGFCMLAAWVLARLEEDEEELARLRAIATSLHVPWRLDTHLPPERRRFPNDPDGI